MSILCPVLELFCDRDGPIAYAEHATGPETLDVWRPAGAGPHPVVVWVHGGGWKFGDLYGLGIREAAARAAAEGLVVVSVSYRRTRDARWPAQAEDVACALGWVHAHAGELGADPARVALVGHSAGGHLALVVGEGTIGPGAGCTWPEAPTPQGVVSLAGPSDLSTFYGLTIDWGRKMLREVLDVPRRDPEALAAALPGADPASMLGPDGPWVVQVAGLRDPLVPATVAVAFDARLAELGRDHRLDLRDTDHRGVAEVEAWLPVVKARLGGE